jgi:predicted ATP-dependent Lon-type protease
VYTSSVDDHATVDLYRLEVGRSSGTGKLKIAGGIEGLMQESIQRAFAYMMSQKVRIGAVLIDKRSVACAFLNLCVVVTERPVKAHVPP